MTLATGLKCSSWCLTDPWGTIQTCEPEFTALCQMGERSPKTTITVVRRNGHLSVHCQASPISPIKAITSHTGLATVCKGAKEALREQTSVVAPKVQWQLGHLTGQWGMRYAYTLFEMVVVLDLAWGQGHFQSQWAWDQNSNARSKLC